MQAPIGSPQSCAIQGSRKSSESSLLGNRASGGHFQTQGWLIDKQQYRQPGRLETINLPTDDLRHVKSDGGKQDRVR